MWYVSKTPNECGAYPNPQGNEFEDSFPLKDEDLPTYVGNGQFSVTIGGLRFLPQAIMISYASGNNWSSNLQGYRFFFAAGNINATENKVTFSSSSVTISVGQYSGADEWFPNENSWQYNFVAFG